MKQKALLLGIVVLVIATLSFIFLPRVIDRGGFEYSFDVSAPFCFGNCAVSEEEAEFINEVEERETAGALPSATGGRYERYTPELVAASEGKDIVIFFKANWCPSCRLLDAHIKANRDRIPENVLILEADYDREGDLKRTYGVTVQHTLVLVASDGSLRKKWSGGGTLESILREL